MQIQPCHGRSVCALLIHFSRIELMNIVFVSVLQNIRDGMRNRQNVYLCDVSLKSQANKQSPERTPTRPTLTDNFDIIFLHNFGRVSKKRYKYKHYYWHCSHGWSVGRRNLQAPSFALHTAVGDVCWPLNTKLFRTKFEPGPKFSVRNRVIYPTEARSGRRKSGTKCAESNFGIRWGTRWCILYNTILTMQYRFDTIEYKSEITHTHRLSRTHSAHYPKRPLHIEQCTFYYSFQFFFSLSCALSILWIIKF